MSTYVFTGQGEKEGTWNWTIQTAGYQSWKWRLRIFFRTFCNPWRISEQVSNIIFRWRVLDSFSVGCLRAFVAVCIKRSPACKRMTGWLAKGSLHEVLMFIQSSSFCFKNFSQKISLTSFVAFCTPLYWKKKVASRIFLFRVARQGFWCAMHYVFVNSSRLNFCLVLISLFDKQHMSWLW